MDKKKLKNLYKELEDMGYETREEAEAELSDIEAILEEIDDTVGEPIH